MQHKIILSAILSALLLVFQSPIVLGQNLLDEQITQPDERLHFNEYYTVSDVPQNRFSKPQLDPLSALTQDEMEWVSFASQAYSSLNLLSWNHHSVPLASPQVPYNRKKHFGGWIVDRESGQCYNTRARVLIRDSITRVEFSENNKCVVTRGEWVDPYTGLTFTRATDLQIDHFIPLKNAYINGAWKWDAKKRCLYSNYSYNNINLVPVAGHENQSKSDGTPAEYMPPNKEFRCEYLQRWLKVKLSWDMTITPPEADAIKKLVVENDCDPRLFVQSPAELEKQREEMEKHSHLCNR